MISPSELLERVDAQFVETSAGLASWPDPHPERMPLDEEYSRVTDPAKWRIVGARADAWLEALEQAGLGTIESPVDAAVEIAWTEPVGIGVTRIDRAMPRAPSAEPLVIARGRIESVDDAALTIGVGEPAVIVESIPDCGCDACDSGSQDALDQLDEYLLAIVSGQFRRLERGRQAITVMPDSLGARNLSRRKVEAVLADPTGWYEVNGASWLGGDRAG